jgi:hypothetical protein
MFRVHAVVEVLALRIGLLNERDLETERRRELDDRDDRHRHRDQPKVGGHQQAGENRSC